MQAGCRVVALLYAAILGAWLGIGERIGRAGFYVLFAITVTVSVQLVGLYLVFATLIVPTLATHGLVRWRICTSYLLGALGYVLGLTLSLVSDLPAGPLVVCAMTALGIVAFAFISNRARRVPCG